MQAAACAPSAAERRRGCAGGLRLLTESKVCGCLLMLTAWQALCFQSPAQHRRQTRLGHTQACQSGLLV